MQQGEATCRNAGDPEGGIDLTALEPRWDLPPGPGCVDLVSYPLSSHHTPGATPSSYLMKKKSNLRKEMVTQSRSLEKHNNSEGRSVSGHPLPRCYFTAISTESAEEPSGGSRGLCT